MKKLFTLAAVAAMAFSVCAQETSSKEDDRDPLEETEEEEDALDITEVEPPHKEVAAWPVFFAVGNVPETPDLVGFRLTIPYSAKQENVTGFDIGFWGRAQYFEGFMLNILRNDVKDQLSGFQVGLYNSADRADLFGVQAGLWNEAGSLRGAQVGLANIVGQMQGVQVGLINRAEDLNGFQIGIVNVIRNAEMAFCPILNVGF